MGDKSLKMDNLLSTTAVQTPFTHPSVCKPTEERLNPAVRQSSVDDPGGILSRFEPPLNVKGLNSTGYYGLPPRHPRDVPAGTAEMFGITVKTVCGRRQEFNVYPDMRGLDLKAWLKPETKAVTGQRLIFEGLDVDDLLTLAEQGLKAGAIVFRLPLVGFFAPHKRYANPPVEGDDTLHPEQSVLKPESHSQHKRRPARRPARFYVRAQKGHLLQNFLSWGCTG